MTDRTNPIREAAEARFCEAACQLGAAHGAAWQTPFVASDRPGDDYSRTIGGYTSYIEHEDGVILLMTALGMPVPEAEEGPWFDACWRVARAYMTAYDSAARAWPPEGVIASADDLAARLREIGTSDTRAVTTSRGTVAVTGWLPSDAWGFSVDAAPATSAGELLPVSLTLNYYESADPPGAPDPDAAPHITEGVMDAAGIIAELTGRL